VQWELWWTVRFCGPAFVIIYTWWFWTVLGGVVAAGVATGVAVRFTYPKFQEVKW
jgi:hypothetical protein